MGKHKFKFISAGNNCASVLAKDSNSSIFSQLHSVSNVRVCVPACTLTVVQPPSVSVVVAQPPASRATVATSLSAEIMAALARQASCAVSRGAAIE